MKNRALVAALLPLAALVACGDDPAAAGVDSTIRVDLQGVGGAFDADGFEVRVDEVVRPRRVDFGAPLYVSVPSGDALTIDLADIAENCSNVSGPSRVVPRPATLHRVTFLVSCAAPADLEARELVLERRSFLYRVAAGHIHDEGADAVLLGPGGRPAVSPDATKIAFLVEGFPYVANHDGTDRRPIAPVTDFPEGLDHLGWSPDGERLVIAALLEDWWLGTRLGVVRLPDDAVAWLGTAQGDTVLGYDAVWSPTEDRIAFGVSWWQSDDPGLFTVDLSGDLAGLSPMRVSDRGQTPVWSPDGGALIYAREGEAGTHLFLAILGEEGVERLTDPESVGDRRITDWSSDGAFLLYTQRTAEREDALDLFALRLSDRVTYRLTVTGDARHAAFLDGGP